MCIFIMIVLNGFYCEWAFIEVIYKPAEGVTDAGEPFEDNQISCLPVMKKRGITPLVKYIMST